MKMLQNGLAGKNEEANSSGQTLVVGVKLDSQSRELLTWVLVKVAKPGDCVIALHVLGNDEIVNRDGKSSLLSLVKAFDSVLAVYEGFCNLKQVDLKLKMCRGSSIQKIIVREVKSYSATKLIVGIGRNHHKIWSSTSIAKYCSRRLSEDCCIFAVNNGKVVFKREGSLAMKFGSRGAEDYGRKTILSLIHQSVSLSKSYSKMPSYIDSIRIRSLKNDQATCQKLKKALMKANSDCWKNVSKRNCSICPEATGFTNICCKESAKDCRNGSEDMSIIPLQKVEEADSAISMLIRELPELKPGWPLLHHGILANQQFSGRSLVKRMSVVQWVMRLPSRRFSFPSTDSEDKNGQSEDQFSNLDGETGAIVPMDIETVIVPASPDHRIRSLPQEWQGLHEKYSATCRLFQYDELLAATSNFSAGNLVGRGGNSQVYRGFLPDGKELAVKILKKSEDALKEFVLEIEIITTLSHKNIISLLGFCFEDNNLLLVYDFLSEGSLEEILYGNKKDFLAFGWNERYKVAVGVAEALDYLHSGKAQPVIHRDVKSSNILLADDFEPQLSDFGLAKWAPTSSSHIICTDVSGTFGYMAPEYFMFGKVNDKIDVYAYGVVLLELLSGKKPISSDYPKGRESLVMWAKPLLNGRKLLELLDSSLGDNYNHDQMERMVLAATLCIRRSPRARPQMSTVVKLLQGDVEISNWARLQANASDESCTRSSIQSHLNLALLDVEDDSLSTSSIEQSVSLEDYLQGRWSRSSSFD